MGQTLESLYRGLAIEERVEASELDAALNLRILTLDSKAKFQFRELLKNCFNERVAAVRVNLN